MGVIICETHGRQGIIHACLHIHEAFIRDESFDDEYQIKRDEIGMTYFLCDICIEKFKFKEIQKLDFDNLIEIGDDLWPICSKCIYRMTEL